MINDGSADKELKAFCFCRQITAINAPLQKFCNTYKLWMARLLAGL